MFTSLLSLALNKKVLDLLDKESTSGESSGRAIPILEPVIFYFHQKTGKWSRILRLKWKSNEQIKNKISLY